MSTSTESPSSSPTRRASGSRRRSSCSTATTSSSATRPRSRRRSSRTASSRGSSSTWAIPNFVFEYEGQAFGPEDISSFILRKVVGDAEIALGEKITDVVITCPAYFGTPEREATANAGRLAGLNVRAILNEPTAAAIAYGLEQGEDQMVLVYDLGGGTFDITMIEIKDRLIRVICTGGDHRLGGVLWDEAIVMYLAEQFRAQTGEASDPLDDPEVLNDLFLQAERGKKTLTQRDKAPFRVTHAGHQARVELDRDKFEEITKHLLDRTIELTHEMLADARGKGYTQLRQDHPRRRGDPDAPGPQPARRRVQHRAGDLRPRRGRRQGGRAVRAQGIALRPGPGLPLDQGRGRTARQAKPVDLAAGLRGRGRRRRSTTWRNNSASP